ncbi:hypothetical protein Tco_0947335, partial [Tanacetum coccineum]
MMESHLENYPNNVYITTSSTQNRDYDLKKHEMEQYLLTLLMILGGYCEWSHSTLKTAEKSLQARNNDIESKSHSVVGIPDEHIESFEESQGCKDLWEAIKEAPTKESVDRYGDGQMECTSDTSTTNAFVVQDRIGRESDVDDSPVNDRFKTGEGFHAVPLPYTGNYIPLRPDLSFTGLDDSVYKTKVSETKTCISKTSKDIIEKPKTVRPSPPIIEDWDTNSDNDRKVVVNVVKQSSPRAAASISTIKPVNTAAPKSKVNDALPITYSYFKAHSPDQWIFDSGCSRYMTRNKSFLTNYQEIDGGFVAFGGSLKEGKITGKGKIRTGKLDFEDVYFVKELKFNLFSVSQMCDKKNNVLFTETECLVLSTDFKLLNETQVLLKVPRQNNMYSFDLKNIVLSE